MHSFTVNRVDTKGFLSWSFKLCLKIAIVSILHQRCEASLELTCLFEAVQKSIPSLEVRELHPTSSPGCCGGGGTFASFGKIVRSRSSFAHSPSLSFGFVKRISLERDGYREAHESIA